MTNQELHDYLNKLYPSSVEIGDPIFKAWCCCKCGKPVDAARNSDWNYQGWGKMHIACRKAS